MLEFELRLQQYIEMVRQGHESGVSGMDGEFGREGVSIGDGGGEQKLVEARAHAKKYLSASGDFGVAGEKQLVYWLTGRGTRWSLML